MYMHMLKWYKRVMIKPNKRKIPRINEGDNLDLFVEVMILISNLTQSSEFRDCGVHIFPLQLTWLNIIHELANRLECIPDKMSVSD